MSNPVRVSEATNLAIHATALMAAEGTRALSAAAIAGALGASKAHLVKVLERLIKAGIVKSKRGPGGGYTLARPPLEVSLREIYEVVEGPLQVQSCLFGVPVCGREHCPLGDLFKKLGAELAEGLSQTTLADYQTEGC